LAGVIRNPKQGHVYFGHLGRELPCLVLNKPKGIIVCSSAVNQRKSASSEIVEITGFILFDYSRG